MRSILFCYATTNEFHSRCVSLHISGPTELKKDLLLHGWSLSHLEERGVIAGFSEEKQQQQQQQHEEDSLESAPQSMEAMLVDFPSMDSVRLPPTLPRDKVRQYSV